MCAIVAGHCAVLFYAVSFGASTGCNLHGQCDVKKIQEFFLALRYSFKKIQEFFLAVWYSFN